MGVYLPLHNCQVVEAGPPRTPASASSDRVAGQTQEMHQTGLMYSPPSDRHGATRRELHRRGSCGWRGTRCAGGC